LFANKYSLYYIIIQYNIIIIMTSTRNNNSLGDYEITQNSIQRQAEYTTYIHGPQGAALQTQFPGEGLLSGRYAPTTLSHNACDIESFLYGIGSVNLVNPAPTIIPNIKRLHSLSIFEKNAVLIPEPLIIEPAQRFHRS
jgi:hypothetical protein